MSIEQTSTVDFISTDPDGNVVLTVSDHLAWNSGSRHLALLQEKLNKYLSFIESGEILDAYPDAQDSRILIRIVAKHAPNDEGRDFLRRAKHIVEAAGFGLTLEAPESC